jgi:hypothetical protein
MTRLIPARALLCLAACASLAAGIGLAARPARAQGDDSATVRLIQLLIAKGILNKDQASSLLTQAQSEAHANHAAAHPARRAAPAAAATQEAQAPEAEATSPGTVRVTYVPPLVRDQIAQQVREQVLEEEQQQGYAQPNEIAEWTKRITVYGDIRLRGERDLMDSGNKTDATIGGVPAAYPFPDYNSINSGSPFDTTGGQIPPLLNTTENRTRFQLRARLGVKADITDWLRTDIRLATGNDNNPVSENQTLGNNTNFGKYSIWLDRAYALLKLPDEDKPDPRDSLKAYVGRFGNPFWTTDLEYSDDLNFDGAAVQGVVPVAPKVNLWATGGAFEVYNTTFNYANSLSDFSGKFPSRDKYLFAGQVGVDYDPTPATETKFAVGLFDYSHVQGEESSPCTIGIGLISDVCNTDNSRPQFLQFGNTLFPIRNIAQIPGASATDVGAGGSTVYANPQYFGLASGFDVLDLHGRVELKQYHPYDISLEGEYSKNLAFNRSAVIDKGPVNNFAPGPNSSQGPYGGGDTAWMLKLELGQPEITKLNQWNVYIGYKHLDTDSVLDAFTDSNFHLGGTNAKGYFLGAGYGLGPNTYLALHYYAATAVVGPKYANDVIQLDLNSKF